MDHEVTTEASPGQRPVASGNHFLAADRLLQEAAGHITAGLEHTGAFKTGSLLLDLLDAARYPLRRLSRVYESVGGAHE